MTWQPIETAPAADGSNRILVFHPKRGIEMQLADGEWWRFETKMGPTHWMPLPDPPEQKP